MSINASRVSCVNVHVVGASASIRPEWIRTKAPITSLSLARSPCSVWMARRRGCMSETKFGSRDQKTPSRSRMVAFSFCAFSLDESKSGSVTSLMSAARFARCHSAHAIWPFHSRVFPGLSGALSLPYSSSCSRLN
eukprot:5571600-Prymnesium_polylepis.2